MSDQENSTKPHAQDVAEQPQEPIDPLAYGAEWLAQVFERMNFDIDIDARIEDDRLHFDASGNDAEYLLGIGTSAPKSVESIQTLLGAALARVGEKRGVVLDVRGWRDQRTERLDSVAVALRDVVVKLGKSVTVAGFNSYERAIVHKALEHDASVQTQSDGQGIFRKLSIRPA